MTDWFLERPTEKQDINDIVIFWGALTRVIGSIPKMFKEFKAMIKVATKSKPYLVHGEAKNQQWIVEHRSELESYLFDDMRDHGYVPVLDMCPGLKWDYNKDKDTFNFVLEARGYKVGKNKIGEILGIYASQGLMLNKDGAIEQLVDIK